MFKKLKLSSCLLYRKISILNTYTADTTIAVFFKHEQICYPGPFCRTHLILAGKVHHLLNLLFLNHVLRI